MEADRHRFAGSDLAGTAAARPENTAAGQKALREKLTAKAAALVPLLRAKAAEIEREGRIPDEVLAAIEAAQLFRLRTPQRFGGFEADIRTYMDVVTELGAAAARPRGSLLFRSRPCGSRRSFPTRRNAKSSPAIRMCASWVRSA